MAGDNHGDKTQEGPQAQEDLGQQQTAQDQPQASGIDWEKAVAERDEKIASLEAQVAEAAKNAETAERLRGEIAELTAQGESDRIDFKLQLAGVRNVKVARCPGRPRRRRRRAQGGGAVAVRRHAREAAWRQDGASQRGHELRRGQDDETLAQARRPGRFQRQRLGG